MTSVASYPSSSRAMSTIYDINDFQLCLILQSTIPRLDVLHKILNFIKTTKLDGKAFMGLSNKRLADLASHDPLTISRFQNLRVAQPQDIQLLLESRLGRPRSPEPTTTTEEETFYTEDTLDEESTNSVSAPDTQSQPSDVLPVPPNPHSHNLAPDTTVIEYAPISTKVDADTQTSTDAAQSGPNGSSLNRETSTHRMAPDETPMNLEPAVAAALELASPIDPHSVPLPQPHNSELDLLNVEEDDIFDDDDDDDEAFSAEEAIDSALEADADGLSSDNDTSDDESQAWSLVGDEEIGEGHVSVENEAEDLQESSSVDAIHETHIEPQSVTPEDTSIDDASNVDASSAQSPPVDESDPGIDQVIGADVDSTLPSDPDGHLEVENIHQREAGFFLPTPLPEEKDEDTSPDISDELSSAINMSEPEIPGDVQDAKKSDSSTINGSVDAGQSSPAVGGPEPLQTVSEQPNTSPLEPLTPAFSEDDDQANASSVMKAPGTFANVEENTPEVAHPSETVTGALSEIEVNDPPEELPQSMPITNETPAINLEESHSEGHSEQPIPSEEPSASPFDSATPEDDQADEASVTTVGHPNREEIIPEVTHHSDRLSTEGSSETVVNELLEEQPDSEPNETPAINMEETHSEWTHSEQPLPLQSHPVSRNPSEAHGESVPTTDDSVVVHPVTEELDPIPSEDSASSAAPPISAQNDDIPVVHEVHPAVNIPVELDISASASPSSSTRSVFSDSPFSTRLHSEFHLVAPVSPVLCLDKCNVLLFCEGICDDYGGFLTSPSIDVTELLPFSSQFTEYEEVNLTIDDDTPAANEVRLVDHPLPSINDDTEPDDPMSFLSLEDFFYDPFALDESIHQNGEPASSSSVNLIDLLDEPVQIEVQAEGPDPTLVPTLLDEVRAETSDPVSAMHEGDIVVTVPGASMNEGHLSDGYRGEEGSEGSEETVQQASNEATSAMHDSDQVTPLPAASGMNEEDEASMLFNETVPRGSDDATSAIQDGDPVVPLPAAYAVDEGQHTDVSDNNQDETSMPFNETVPQASNNATSAIRDSDPVIPLPAASTMDNLTDVDDNEEETVQQASNESISDEPSSDRTLHAVEPSRFNGLPPIVTNITSLSDDLSAYMSPSEDCNMHNAINHMSYSTPFSSWPRLSPGSPRSPRTLFPMCEGSTTDRTIANYAKRHHEALERPVARSIAIQTDSESLDLQRRIQEENSTVASSSISPLSIFSQLFGR